MHSYDWGGMIYAEKNILDTLQNLITSYNDAFDRNEHGEGWWASWVSDARSLSIVMTTHLSMKIAAPNDTIMATSLSLLCDLISKVEKNFLKKHVTPPMSN